MDRVDRGSGSGRPALSRLTGSDTGKPEEKLKNELNRQLRNLVYPGFLNGTPWERLQHVPRYLKGMILRLDKYSGNPERDMRHAAVIAGFWQQYERRLEKHRKTGIDDSALTEFRWQVEELRVSLFAQELKTPYPVSVKRLQKLWEEVAA
jgi:ATP-dependent helicase HrpA